MPDCPDCEREFRGRTCPTCGWRPAGSSAAPEDRRCAWTTGGERCFMAGAIGAKVGRCAWHSYGLSDPTRAENLEELERWVAMLRAERYCADWTHYRVDTLWQAIRGRASLAAAHPTACDGSACPHRPAEVAR